MHQRNIYENFMVQEMEEIFSKSQSQNNKKKLDEECKKQRKRKQKNTDLVKNFTQIFQI